MDQAYIERWTEFAKKAQQPLQSWAKLQAETLQKLNYIRPEEWSNLQKDPQKLMQKNVELMIENGQQILDHMQKSLKIFGDAMLTMVEEANKASCEFNVAGQKNKANGKDKH